MRCTQEFVAESVSIQRFITVLLTVLAGIPLVLSTIGLYDMQSLLGLTAEVQKMSNAFCRTLAARP